MMLLHQLDRILDDERIDERMIDIDAQMMIGQQANQLLNPNHALQRDDVSQAE